MVAIAFLTQNAATGLAFGSFGTIIIAMEREFGAQREMSSLALSLLILSLSLTASVIGSFIDRLPIRWTMLTGVVLTSLGYLLVSIAHTMGAVLAIYALLLGPGVALSGVLVSNTLAARWVPKGTGRALGIVNMPIFVMLVPLVVGWLLPIYGLRVIYLGLAAAQIAVVPAILCIVERPSGPNPNTAGERSIWSGAIAFLGRRDFWMIALAIGIISGGGAMKVAHFVPLLIGQGHGFEDANLLLAISGGAGALGSLAFGWLADRIGPAPSLAANAFTQAIVWMILLSPVGMGLLVVDAVLVGACGGGASSALGALFTRLYGPRNFARVYGLISVITLPFVFGLPWLAGLLYRLSGSYFLPVGLQIGGFVVAGLLMAGLRTLTGSKPLAGPAQGI